MFRNPRCVAKAGKTSSRSRLLAAWGILLCFSGGAAAGDSATTVGATASPGPEDVRATIQARLKPEVYRRVVRDRDIMVHAKLSDVDSNLKKYAFYATMLVHASKEKTRQVLTDYPLYAKMIPYIDRADFNPKTQVLLFEGGIWKFQLKSLVHFEERGNGIIHYQVIGGHFTGMTGDLLFAEPSDQLIPGTVVYFHGELTGANWPPRFVIERGAEIVFGFTGRRMRSYIEAQAKPETGNTGSSRGNHDDSKNPTPRSHL